MPDREHDELQELLGAYALGAVSDAEREAIEAHLETCSDCRAELDEMAMPLAALRVARDHGRVPTVHPTEAAPASRRRRLRLELLGLALALIAVGVVGLLLGHERSENTDLRNQLAASRRPLEFLAGVREDAAQAHLTGNAALADLIVLPDGRSLLWRDTLAPLPPGEAYQLWSVVDAVLVPAGSLGRDPALLVSSSPPGITEMVITRGRAGDANPEDPVVASGRVVVG
ncbi:MAG: anti-sigma factor [Acidimicrobiales bacterium]